MNLAEQTVNVADRVRRTQAEGPGWRFALWVQGCPLRRPGCCNPEMLEFRPAEQRTVASLIDEVTSVADIEGITFVGGEPFSQARPLALLSRELRRRDLSVMVFSGFTLGHLRDQELPEWNEFLDQIDLLIDGPYLQQQRVTDRRWIGSANQQIHFLSERYRDLAEDRRGWDRSRNTVEIRLVNGEIQVNGFPHNEIG